MNLVNTIKETCYAAIRNAFPEQAGDILPEHVEVTQSTNKSFGHYQCNSAMKLSKLLSKSPRDIAPMIIESLDTAMFSKIEVAGPGFINLSIKESFISQTLNSILQEGKDISKSSFLLDSLDGDNNKNKKVVIDFSSPNIAKEMHVGHLRSTIIGDCIARTLEMLNYDVLRLNHVGDWGTQFGMLIAFLKNKQQVSTLNDLTLADLVQAYRASKELFDNDDNFKKQAQLEVVELQGGNKESRAIWQQICQISRSAFEEIYELLDVNLTERGESFYNPFLADVVNICEAQKILEISDGAKCIYLEGFTNRNGDPLPLIIQKQDGGYNYATTDLAGIKHRIESEHAKWIIYVTDAGQAQHFAMVFAAAKKAGIYKQDVRIDHVPFGVVLKEDGKKFKTREGKTERLIDLLNTAVSKAYDILTERNQGQWDEVKLNNMSSILGINAIKYADLCNNRTSDYVFSYERMLQFQGNTAAYLSYSFVRVQSIKRKINSDISSIIPNTKIIISEDAEIELGLHIAQFPETLDSFIKDLLPNRITDYLYKLAEKFHTFYQKCKVEGHEYQNNRLLLCELTSQVMLTGFQMLGLKILEEM